MQRKACLLINFIVHIDNNYQLFLLMNNVYHLTEMKANVKEARHFLVSRRRPKAMCVSARITKEE